MKQILDLEKNIAEFIKLIGEDIHKDGLAETPRRSAKVWLELLDGYNQDDSKFYKTFKTDTSDIIIVKDIEFISFCEHHLMPFQGLISIGYIPDEKVLGLSKFGRIVDCFAKRLQIQEKLVYDIGNSIITNLKPKHLFIICKATHSCMACRGIKKQKSNTINLYTYGKFKNYNEFDILKILD